RCQEDSATSVEPTYSIAVQAASTRWPATARAEHLPSPLTPRGPVPRGATDRSPPTNLSER
ncbi:uncharacterized protein SCHCODRAFT_02488577, partial [Schizophyllum commune H4-8]|uniref:uncharacterized protein n=1 Tax=Schizophyllum commune (strain H4-8 / FGSC 9210) TaxID=578458 RepID=UPI00215E5D48